MELIKKYDWFEKGLCSQLEVTVDWDPETRTVNRVERIEATKGVASKMGSMITYFPPSEVINLTNIFHTCFPDFIRSIELDECWDEEAANYSNADAK